MKLTPGMLACSLFLFLCFAGCGAKQDSTSVASVDIELTTPTLVEISCGECQFKLKGKGCDLAIRHEGRGYYVDGYKIDHFGDAHAKDGFCNAIRQAQVTGQLSGGRFMAKTVELLPAAKP